jgi:hypothetical protein
MEPNGVMSHAQLPAGDRVGFAPALPSLPISCGVLQAERTKSAAPAGALPVGRSLSPVISGARAAAGSSGPPDQQQHQRGSSLGAAAQRPEPSPNRRWKLPTINRSGNDSAAPQPRCAEGVQMPYHGASLYAVIVQAYPDIILSAVHITSHIAAATP